MASSSMEYLGLTKASQADYLLYRRERNKIKKSKNSNSHLLHETSLYKKKIKQCFNVIILFAFIYLQLTVTLPNLRQLGNMKCSNWFDTNCIQLMWKGDSVADLSKSDTFEVSLVISSCGEEMDSFTKYTNDVGGANIIIKSTTIISGPNCSGASLAESNTSINIIGSRWEYSEVQFLEWIASMTKLFNATVHSQKLLEDYQHNGFILFLNEKSMQYKNIRNLEDILQSTIDNGFGCLQRPADKMSYYHNGHVLGVFSNPNATAFTHYDNFGDYLQRVELFPILTKDLVPVCYGSSFAISSRDLFKKAEPFHIMAKAIVSDFETHEQEKVVQYIERVLASIFSYILPKEKTKKLMKYRTGVNEQTESYGAYTHEFRKSYLFKYFRGDTLEDVQQPENLRLTVVISRCHEDMSWMKEFLKPYDVENVTIYSKCNTSNKDNPLLRSKLIEMPNYGRCDHSYAHWMANMTEEDATDNHLVIFLKASRSNAHHLQMGYRSLKDMIRIANANGFACGYENSEMYFHNTPRMRDWLAVDYYKGRIIKSAYANMGQWLDAMDISLPTPTTPVCYGGNFVAKASQIFKKKSSLKRMEESLTRGDSIEEGHFAERTWAGLLSYPLNSNQTNVLQSIPTVISGERRRGYVGSIFLNG